MSKIMNRCLLALLLLLSAHPAGAQGLGPSTIGSQFYPNWYTGFVPTPFQWNLYWSNKLDWNPNGLPIALGGTGGVSAAQARANLGVSPATVGTSILYGNGVGGTSNVTIGSGITFSAGTLSATGTGGTVTSVGLSDSSSSPIFSISGSPVTGTGTLAETLLTQSANRIFAGPTTGAAAQPTFRALVGADLPLPGASSLGGIESFSAVTHQFLRSISTSGVPSAAQPACADISDSSTGCATTVGTAATQNTGTSGATIPLLNGANTWSGIQSFGSGDLLLKGATSGTLELDAPAVASTSKITLPAGTTDFSATGGTSQVVKQVSSGAPFTVARLACADLSDSGPNCTSSSSGALVLVSTQTASTSATLQWTGLGSSFNTYFLDCNGLIPANSGGQGLILQFGEGVGPTWKTSGYVRSYVDTNTSSTVSGGWSTGSGNIILTGNFTGTGNAAPSNYTTKHWISNIASGTQHKVVTGTYFNDDTVDSTYGTGSAGGSYDGDTTVVTAIRVMAGSGNLTSGQCSLYSVTP